MNLVLSLASGVLLVLIFPNFNFSLLAPVALTPLLVACAREASWKRRFVLGWASGFVFWFAVCSWIQFVLEVHGGMGRWGGWGTFALFALLKGLYTATFAALAGPVMRKPWAIPGAAALWTAVEYAHGTIGLAWVGLGFAWLDLGNAGIDMPLIPRLAPITGVWGLSFVLAMIGCAIALAFLRRPLRKYVTHYTWLAAFALLPLLPELPPPHAGTERVRVVQPNIDTEAEWTPETMAVLQQRMILLSEPANAPLIVWPEAPAPFYPAEESFRKYMGDLARNAQAPILMGGVGRTPTGDPLNSAFLFQKNGELSADRYDKIRLVPFGEYIPDAFGWVNRITHEIGDFVPGTRIVTFPVDGHRIGAFICYESAFPDLVRQFTKSGANVLVNLSNDGYFGHSAAREQHLELVRMRAAENRRWILRATNDGITAMIDPAGREIARLPLYTQTSAVFGYNSGTGLTPYVRYGDWFAWMCLLTGAISYGGSRGRRRP
ncbi:MAG: apolipoprotein N-acyltransferase [Acidobacteriia bacterium]|nr:apolipoprotein N-acyltransferase [Terriglobia bacterium]